MSASDSSRGALEQPGDAAQPPAAPRRIAGRYRVCGELGRGGMSQVYRVHDENQQREVALKLLLPPGDATRAAKLIPLFEREFHTLAQLRHPHVIEVYDYGRDESGAYYTMELLDGGDLRELSPLPWQEACRLTFEVCSSLALLHSRRLVHCDISPRNIRCTNERQAKLIDFGAMAPMGPGQQIVGTPAFISPEVVNRSTLDARTDLFSLGATLYFALTGRTPFAAISLFDVQAAWATKPVPPSRIVPGIPAALDVLVTSMLGIEPAFRPRTAFDVMQRLAGIAGLQGAEPTSVSRAYLATPVMVGRDKPLFTFRYRMQHALSERGGAMLIEGAPGVGRSRLLDACVLEAKTLGVTALRAHAGGTRTLALSSVQALAEQLLTLLPEPALDAARALEVLDALFTARADADAGAARATLKAFAGPDASLPLQQALTRWFKRISEKQPLAIAVDDVDAIDDPSVGWLAALAHEARRSRLLVLATAKTGAASPAFEVFSRYCSTRITLKPLAASETDALFISMFDDVPNVRLLSDRIHAVAGGRPRESMALAQQLLESGKLIYKGGSWTLPAELSGNDLPASVREMLRARLAGLSALPRWLAEAHALSLVETLTRDDYVALRPNATPEQIDSAITSLIAYEVLSSDGVNYSVSNSELRAELQVELDANARAERHAALAERFERAGTPALIGVHHRFAAGQNDAALDRLLPLLRATKDWAALLGDSQMLATDVARCIELALDTAEHEGRSARELNDLRCWLMLLSVSAEDALYWRSAPPLLAQLREDSGLNFWHELAGEPDPGARLTQALTRAAQRYEATPERERVYRVDEAIRLLVSYSAATIPIGVRALDAALIRSVPPLLEPFAPLSPVLKAMWQNALATRETSCDRVPEQARLRWIEVYEQLGSMSAAELPGVSVLRPAIAYGIGMTEAQLGMSSASHWADILERDPLQRVTALYLRKAIMLQRGDFDEGERARRQAELLSIQASARQPFVTPAIELVAHAAAHDLRGLKQTADRMAPLVKRYPNWQPFADLAQGHFHRLRGELDEARAAFEQGLARARPDPSDPQRSIAAWPALAGAYIEVLVELEQYAKAKQFADAAIATCRERKLETAAIDIQRALALVECKLDDYPAAAARLDALIEMQRKLDVAGLNIGATYEARARIAIWARDQNVVEHYAGLAAHEYRHGRGSPLGARYERLMREAHVAGMEAPALAEFQSTVHIGTTDERAQTHRTVAELMQAASDARARAASALHLLCDAFAAVGGHLYLVGHNGLRCVASQGVESPDTALAAQVSDFWQAQCTEAPTLYIDSDNDNAALPPWTDARGMAFRPLLINCQLDGDLVQVGVALLVRGATVPGNTNIPLTTWIAEHILEAGDSPGIRAA